MLPGRPAGYRRAGRRLRRCERNRVQRHATPTRSRG